MNRATSSTRPGRAVHPGPLPLAALAALAAACADPSPGAGRAFVSEAATGRVAVVDLATGEVRARIEVGLLPHNLLLSPDGRRLYAVTTGSQAVAVVDVEHERLERTFLTAPVPERRGDGSLIAEHAEQGAAAHTTCFDCHRDGGAQPRYVGGRPLAMRLSPDGARLYVAHVNTGELSVLDTATGALLRRTALAPSGTAREPTALDLLDGELLVALRPPQPSRDPGVVRRLDPDTLEALGEVETGADPVDLRALPGRGLALVTRFDSNLVQAVGPAGGGRTFTVASGPLGLAPLPDGRVLTLGYYSNAISLLDPATGAVDTLPLARGGRTYANPTHAAPSPDGRSAWIVSSGTEGHLLRLDLASRTVEDTYPIAGLSFGVAVVSP